MDAVQCVVTLDEFLTVLEKKKNYSVIIQMALNCKSLAYSQPCQTSKIEHFAKIVNG